MGVFFIDTERGQVATHRQLVEAGVADERGQVPRPWLRIQGTSDASTLWYAVLRRPERGVYLGALAMRHGPQHQRLLERGWEEVPVEAIGLEAGSVPAPGPLDA